MKKGDKPPVLLYSTSPIEQGSHIAARDLEKVAKVREHGIPIYLNASIKEARGKGKVEEIDVLQHDEMM
ncbi:hypothetical protein [Fictibacillus terranigra]|uniref:Uncharacterized protein n=1 Tax=Fictibacillus terranigra TaxID=3058424 RepID=A0ABT8E977_9BACL|nr:hypothetical protein [Fictibacillus sp. CENA-BCM004]MDN4074437.1 hypothetical protein [Fictibacillus sp. CENA-BCM004]